jgi:type IX secretion system PorP/SprF family membrane protein
MSIKQYRIALLLAHCSLITAFSARSQQTLQLTQYTFNGLAVNPAYAGYNEDWMLRAGYRLQWAGMDGAPRTATISFDGVIGERKKTTGVGILVTNDRLGPQNTSSAWLNYAYRLKLDEEDTRRLSFGAAFGITQYRLDASGFVATDILDNNLPVSDESSLAPDLRAGIYYCSSSFYTGLSAINLLSSQVFSGINIIRQERHYYFVAGGLLSLGPMFDMKPSVLVKDDLKGPTNIDVTNYLAIRRTLWIGASYRYGVCVWNRESLQDKLDHQDAVALLTQVYWKERYRFGYSFDFTTSRLSGSESGTHEISLGITFPRKKERILSPRFF